MRLAKAIDQTVRTIFSRPHSTLSSDSRARLDPQSDRHETRSDALWITLPRLLGNRFHRFAFHQGRKRRLNVRRSSVSFFRRNLLHEALEPKVMLAVRVWDGGGLDNNLSSAANWVGDVAPLQDDDLVFAGNSRLSPVNDYAGSRFRSISFTSAGFNVTGQSLTLLQGINAGQTTGGNTIGTDLTFGANQSINTAVSGASLTLSGNVNTGNLHVITVDGSGDTSINGVISNTGSLSKLGSGTLILNNDNTYEGFTSVQQGVLRIRSGGALGSTNLGTEVTSGATLEVQNNITVAEPLMMGGHGVALATPNHETRLGRGALWNSAGSNTWTGTIVLTPQTNAGQFTVDSGTQLEVTGRITALQSTITTVMGITKSGLGVLRLSGSQTNDYTGTTKIVAGVLELNKTGGAQAFMGSLFIGDRYGITGVTSDLTNDNVAQVRLLQDDQIPSLDFSNVNLQTLTVSTTGKLDLNNHNDSVGAVTMELGGVYSPDITTGNGTLTLGGTLLATGLSTISAVLHQSNSPPATISGKLALGNLLSAVGTQTNGRVISATEVYGGVGNELEISADISGPVGVPLGRQGAGDILFSGNNAGLLGGVVINNAVGLGAPGITRIASDHPFGSGLLALQGTPTLEAVGAPRTITNPVSIDSDLRIRGTNNLTFAGLATLTNATTRQITTFEPTQVTTFAGGITEGVFGSASLNKAGRGELRITSPADYSGTTTVAAEGGTLTLSDSGTILNSSSINLNPGSAFKIDNSGLNLPDRVNNLVTVQGSGGRLLLTGRAGEESSESIGLLNVPANLSASIELDQNSAISNRLIVNSLTMSTTSTLHLIGTQGDLSRAGDNRVSFLNPLPNMVNGILPNVTVTGAAGTEFATWSANAEGAAIYALPSSAYITDINQAGPTSNVKLLSTGGPTTYTLNYAKTINSLYVGENVTLQGSTALTVGSGGLIFGGSGTSAVTVEYLTLPASAMVLTEDAHTAAISSRITGAATSFAKVGSGTLILAAANEFGGQMNVNAGKLKITHDFALGTSVNNSVVNGTIVNAGATLELAGDINVPLEALTLTGLGVNQTTGALVSSAGSNNWSGTVTPTGVLTDGYDFVAANESKGSTVTLIRVLPDSSLNLLGVIATNSEVVKTGGGTLAYSGVTVNNTVGA
ncbi:MAG: autotransporter-associated beta strand repeat-containing protein, partial [Planctomycetaceae bacterium]|nr:autotransporter-associated beta strand repeat-containing protein [Planctomycetaceae bacterium]